MEKSVFTGILEESVSAEVSEESVSGVSGVLEDPSPPSPLEYPAKAITRLFDQINELNLGIPFLSALTIGMGEEEEEKEE